VKASRPAFEAVDIVTGGAGFIGSHVVDALIAAGRRVRVIDNLASGRRENLAAHADSALFQLVDADVSDRAALDTAFQGAERVFHLAALADIVPSIQNPDTYFRTNVDGTYAVVQAALAAGVRRFVYAASSSCYGIPDAYPTPETAAARPQYPYALTKYLGEQIVLHWAQTYALPAVSLRFFNVYGPRARTSGTYGAVFGVFIAQILAGQPLTIVGDGTQTRDFTYVTDAADALLAAAESDVCCEVFNVGSGASVSINRIVELLGAERTVHLPKRPGEPDRTFAAISKIGARLGWRPTVCIDDGIERMRAHFDSWRGAPVWTPQSIAEATKDWFRYLGNEQTHEREHGRAH
jgi:UDP-glucose 4-epimerase